MLFLYQIIFFDLFWLLIHFLGDQYGMTHNLWRVNHSIYRIYIVPIEISILSLVLSPLAFYVYIALRNEGLVFWICYILIGSLGIVFILFLLKKIGWVYHVKWNLYISFIFWIIILTLYVLTIEMIILINQLFLIIGIICLSTVFGFIIFSHIIKTYRIAAKW